MNSFHSLRRPAIGQVLQPAGGRKLRDPDDVSKDEIVNRLPAQQRCDVKVFASVRLARAFDVVDVNAGIRGLKFVNELMPIAGDVGIH